MQPVAAVIAAYQLHCWVSISAGRYRRSTGGKQVVACGRQGRLAGGGGGSGGDTEAALGQLQGSKGFFVAKFVKQFGLAT